MFLKKMLKEKLKKIRKRYLAERMQKKISVWKEQEPVFILGTQKTGTTAIAALLGKSCNENVTLDLLKSINDSAWPLRVSYGLESFASFVDKYEEDFSNKFIKEPWLTFFYEDLCSLYPKARFIMVVRNPFDTIRSVLNRLDIPGNKTSINFNDYQDLNAIKIWRLALDSSWSGRSCDDYISAMANRWDIAAKVYLENKDNFYLIRYEDFLKNKVESISDLAHTLGYESPRSIEEYVDVQYQVKGDRDTDLEAFFGEENHQKIRSICGDSARLLGYAI